jgi:hypothetical protein
MRIVVGMGMGDVRGAACDKDVSVFEIVGHRVDCAIIWRMENDTHTGIDLLWMLQSEQ